MPRKTPWYKGIIERFQKTLNNGVAHTTPGTTFHNIMEKDDYDSSKHAVVTLSTLKEMIHLWVIDYYHQSSHRALGRPPIAVWNENVDENQIPLPVKMDEITALMGAIEKRTVTHKGVELNHLFYNSLELNDMRLRYGERFKTEVRFDGGDLGFIYVIDPHTNVPIKVPAIREDYATGLSLWQHKMIRQYAKRYIASRTDVEALAEAKQKLRELIARDFIKKKIKSRSRIGRFMEKLALDEERDNERPASRPHAQPVSPTQSIQDTGSPMLSEFEDTFDDALEIPELSSSIQPRINNVKPIQGDQ
jgi:putative transposase